MKRVSLTTLAILVFTVAALAQSNTGRLVGTISDPSGVIPGATVLVRDNQTGKERTVVTNDDGSFSVPQLDPGTYTVTITAQGHKTYTASEVKIDVAKDYSLNPVLEVGQISESITVVAGADVINATNGELTNTVSPRQIIELPLNGRNPLNLVGLQAGTSQNGAQTTSINGQRSTFTNVTRDGLNIQDNYIRGNAVDFVQERPSVDDTAEFTITTQNASADSGYGASQIQLVTPRGQNEFHGALFEYNRNSKFAANSYFRNRNGQSRLFLNRNQFGGKLQGPIIKNKLFFFGSYEGLRLKQSTTINKTILLPSARSGLFTYRDNAGVTRTVNLFGFPLTSPAGVPAFTIAGVNPTIQARFLATTPSVPNTTAVGDQLNTGGFAVSQKGDQTRNGYTTRIDLDIDERNSINGVFSLKSEANLRNDATNNFDTEPDVVQPSKPKFFVVAWRSTPNATVTNELRVGTFRGGPVFTRTNPLPASFFGSLVANATTVDSTTLAGLISNPETDFTDQGRYTIYYNIQDNAEYIRGNHSFRFGAQIQTFDINNFVNFGVIPSFALGTNTLTTPFISTAQFTNAALFPGGISTGQRTTANALVALLGGIVSRGSQTFNVDSQSSGFVSGAEERRRYRYDNVGLYLADQWRVSPSLTLNLGLRYELYTALREVQGLFIEPAIANGADPVATVLNPVGQFQFVGGNAGNKKLYNTDKNNFGPVLSFAWSPTFKNKFMNSIFPGEGRTVLRGGYRISYVNDDLVVSQQNSVGLNQGLSFNTNAFATNGSININARADALPGIATPTFNTLPRSFAANNTAANAFFSTIFGIDPNLQSPRIDEYSFGIQRELGWQTALEVRYVGSRSNSLVRAIDYNQINIRSNGFLADFENARFNLINFGAADCTTPGCRPVGAFFNQLGPFGGLFNAGFAEPDLLAGTPANLALGYLQNTLNTIGGIPAFPNAQRLFLANPVAGAVDFVENSGTLRYNALQIELRRRFSDGLYFQANYTFQKTLGNSSGGSIAENNTQTRFEPNLDNAQPQLEYSRVNYDQAQVFNVNAIYELPFGKGKRFFSDAGSLLNRIVGGWQMSNILRASTGAPINISDPRATLNRSGRFTRQTAQSTLSKDQIKDLIGIFKTPCGVFYIDPQVINLNLDACSRGLIQPRAGSTAGVGSIAPTYVGATTGTFPGQVFFNNAPGQGGGLERNFINGPFYFNWDAGMIKNIPITERVRFQMRIEVFNVLNRANLAVTAAQQQTLFNINSTNFGRLTAAFPPRIIQFAGRLEF
ncbi:MAG TPA: carboxypeptidase-like regulatory domain-containing protein [Pyrinomonadaceae bacterium]|jgi:hypothetical protein